MPDDRKKWFSNGLLIWPFGRVEGERPQEGENNNLYIGREKQRAQFLRLLLNHPHKGAYLITGSRGSGKTRFVNYCLETVAQNFLTRFMRSPKGRIWFWDRILVILMIFALSTILSGLNEFWNLLFRNTFPKCGLGEITWSNIPIIIALGTVALWPCIYGIQLFISVFNFSKCKKADQPPFCETILFVSNSIIWFIITFFFIYSSTIPNLIRFKVVPIIMVGIGLVLLLLNLKLNTKSKPDLPFIASFILIQKSLFFILLSIHITFIPILEVFNIQLPTPIPSMYFALFTSATLLLIATIEHKKIVIPFGIEKYRLSTKTYLDDDDQTDWYKQMLVRHTFTWAFHKTWIPIMNVKLNLGFDHLDYRRISEAMLLGLKQEFFQAFLSWKSTFANLSRLVLFCILVVYSFRLGDILFAKTIHQENITNNNQHGHNLANNDKTNIYQGLENHSNFIDIFLARTSHLLQTELISLRKNSDQYPILNFLFHHTKDRQANSYDDKYRLYLYHILLMIFGYLLYSKYSRVSPFTPYERINSEIENLLSNLSGKRQQSILEKAQFKFSKFVGEKSEETKWVMDPLDPRTVEIELMKLLDQIRSPGLGFPGMPFHGITLPAAEVTFIFDELDKLGGSLETPGNKRSDNQPTGAHKSLLLYQEQLRHRPLAIQELLANMKNLLNAGEARFIFIGGRDLHDEWVADISLRQPFLTNIFDAEIYLPSFVTDHQHNLKNIPRHRFTDRIREYIDYRHYLAQAIFEERKKERDDWLSPPKPVLNPTFKSFGSPNHPKDFKMYHRMNTALEADFIATFRSDFIKFLTFRSSGVPRQLNGLLNSFLANIEHLQDKEKVNISGTDLMEISLSFNKITQEDYPPIVNTENPIEEETLSDILLFNDTDIYRIQMIASIYDKLSQYFEEKLILGDDKPVIILFYIANFVLKFHKRAISWSGIERIDEMMDVHRTPETRAMLKSLLESWTDRYLEHIHNGLFDFRFRSEFSIELRYLSRLSQSELAVVNFTLDESRMLKDLYHRLLQDETEEDNQEYRIALAELHEFDGDFEHARVLYQQALTRSINMRSETPEILGVINQLKLKLRIALTRERSQSLETARAIYHDCCLISEKHISLLFSKNISSFFQNRKEHELIKTFNLLFLPIFAEAWVCEKLSYSVDAAPDMVERYIHKIRKNLPFYNHKNLFPLSTSPSDVKHITYFLVMGEMHKNVGDLYFFKGRDWPLPPKEVCKEKDKIHSTTGYQLAASRHYVTGLHEIRRFHVCRIASSWAKYGLAPSNKKASTLQNERFADFPSRQMASLLRALSFSIFSRISPVLLFKKPDHATGSLKIPKATPISDIENHTFSAFLFWLKNDDTSSTKPQLPGQDNYGMILIEDFLGKLNLLSTDGHILTAAGESSNTDRLYAAIIFWLIECRILQTSGYREKAFKSYLQLAEIIEQLLYWEKLMEMTFNQEIFIAKENCSNSMNDDHTAHWIKEISAQNPQGKDEDAWLFLEKVASYIFKKCIIHLKYHSGCQTDKNQPPENFKKNMMQSHLTHLICSFNLLKEDIIGPMEITKDNFYTKVLKSDNLCNILNRNEAIEILKETLSVCSFPISSRLKGLKIIIDSHYLISKHNELDVSHLINELHCTSERYNDHGFFENFYQGFTFALTTLNGKPPFQDYSLAAKMLHKSMQSFTMGKAYYNGISNYFFLFEDFSDRNLQFGHCMQMAGAEMNMILQVLLKFFKIRTDPKPDPTPGPSNSSPAEKSSISKTGSRQRKRKKKRESKIK